MLNGDPSPTGIGDTLLPSANFRPSVNPGASVAFLSGVMLSGGGNTSAVIRATRLPPAVPALPWLALAALGTALLGGALAVRHRAAR